MQDKAMNNYEAYGLVREECYTPEVPSKFERDNPPISIDTPLCKILDWQDIPVDCYQDPIRICRITTAEYEQPTVSFHVIERQVRKSNHLPPVKLSTYYKHITAAQRDAVEAWLAPLEAEELRLREEEYDNMG
jgi:hypothetical protein